MKSFAVLISFLAITGLVLAEQQDEGKNKKKHQQAQVARQGGNQQNIAPYQKNKNKNKNYGVQPRAMAQPRAVTTGQPTEMGANVHSKKFAKTHKGAMEQSTAGAVTTARSNQRMVQGQNQARHFQRRHFDLANTPNPNIPRVTFSSGAQIQGAQHWRGERYAAFRNYRSEWHDRDWWNHHHNRVVFVFGGWYYWNAGYYYPAWGYAPDSYYAYDGPIYTGSEDADPGQVVANVQSALQQEGYYTGDVDGILGPLTRAALAQYQEAQGIEPTGAIDEPTLASLGMV